MPGLKSQQLDFRVLLGDTAKDEVWEELSSIVNEVWEREDGAYLPLRLMTVDSGYNASRVYVFTKKHGFSRTIPIKGQEALETLFSPPRAIDIQKHGKKIGKQKVWHVGVNYIKSELYGFLRQSKNHDEGTAPNGYCYFPKRDPHYFRGLTAEVQQMTRNKRGYLKYVWVKKYDRNEPLDCRVYARAAAAIIGIDRWKEQRWKQEHLLSTVEKPVSDKPVPKPVVNKPNKPKSSFWNR
jgi:phage terminase large subunit GpA-like protein